MAKEDFRYKSEFRVRFGETDLQGVVFNANYLLYTDTTQLDYFRRIGVPYNEVRRQATISISSIRGSSFTPPPASMR